MANPEYFYHNGAKYELALGGALLAEGASGAVSLAVGHLVPVEDGDEDEPGEQQQQQQPAQSVDVVVKTSHFPVYNPLLSREACLLRRVRHGPHIVNVLHNFVGVDQLRRLVIYPRLSNSLADLIDARNNWRDDSTSGRLPLDNAALFLAQLARGICFLQKEGLAHRDLSSKNCGISEEDGSLKIFDLGSGIPATRDNGGKFYWGSPGFVGVESLLGSRDHRYIDTFIFGAVIGHLLSGHGPFSRGPEGTPSLTLSSDVSSSSSAAEVSDEASSSAEARSGRSSNANSGDGRSSSSDSADELDEDDREYRAQQLRRISMVLGPIPAAAVAVIAPRFPTLAVAEDAGGKALQLGIRAMFQGRCATGEEREAFLSTMEEMLRYDPLQRPSPWIAVKRFLEIVEDQEGVVGRFFANISHEEIEDIRAKLDPDSARDLLVILGQQ